MIGELVSTDYHSFWMGDVGVSLILTYSQYLYRSCEPLYGMFVLRYEYLGYDSNDVSHVLHTVNF